MLNKDAVREAIKCIESDIKYDRSQLENYKPESDCYKYKLKELELNITLLHMAKYYEDNLDG